jgi:thiol-disulfide isomerase/thioredoxin
MKIKYYITTALLCPIFSIAQHTSYKDIQPLSIGDTVPNFIINNIINYKDSIGNFSNFKGKLVILDFFETICSPCIESLPHLNELQQKFGNKLQVLLVSSQKTSVIQYFFQNNSVVSAINLPLIVQDSLLTVLFPHKILPHVVWIDGMGKVRAITSREWVTSDHIASMINGHPIPMPLKTDNLLFDATKDLFEEGNGGDGQPIIFKSIFTRRIKGVGSPSGLTRKQQYLLYFHINKPLLTLYQQAYREIFGKRIILKVKDSAQFVVDRYHLTDWLEHNSYSYELRAPLSTPIAQLSRIMIGDLDNFLGAKSKVEILPVPCYRLVEVRALSTNSSDNISGSTYMNRSMGLILLKYQPVSELVRILNQVDYPGPGLIILPPKSENLHTLTMQLNISGILELNILQKMLHTYGFELQPEIQNIPMLVITQN